MATKKNPMRIVQWPYGGGERKMLKPSYFEGKSHMLLYLSNEFLLVAIIKQDSLNFLLYFVTSNQIWFILHVNNHQSTNLTKLKKKKINSSCHVIEV